MAGVMPRRLLVLHEHPNVCEDFWWNLTGEELDGLLVDSRCWSEV
jgi:hypothetical protein